MEENKPMSELEQAMLDAIAIITRGGIDKAKIPATIECTIVEIEDAGKQLYKVEYMSNTFTATSSSGSYNVGDVVYVHIPEGDLSKTKIIIGAVEESSENLVETELLDEYVETSDNLLWNLNDNYAFCSYYSPTIYNSNINNDSKNKIQKSIKDNHKSFLLTAKFKTDLSLEQRVNGNYGVRVILPVLQDPGTGETYEQNPSVQKRNEIISIDKNTI